MKKASVRDLHIRTSELIRDAANGAVIVIELIVIKGLGVRRPDQHAAAIADGIRQVLA